MLDPKASFQDRKVLLSADDYNYQQFNENVFSLTMDNIEKESDKSEESIKVKEKKKVIQTIKEKTNESGSSYGSNE
jgi:hypothetical protein